MLLLVPGGTTNEPLIIIDESGRIRGGVSVTNGLLRSEGGSSECDEEDESSVVIGLSIVITFLSRYDAIEMIEAAVLGVDDDDVTFRMSPPLSLPPPPLSPLLSRVASTDDDDDDDDDDAFLMFSAAARMLRLDEVGVVASIRFVFRPS